MRLLEASTLRLVSVRENALPPYAILSHTWGSDEDEVSLQDIESLRVSYLRKTFATHPVSRKHGFIKIRESARLALSQGLKFIWVDTCCIDKSSSAELSEAINSMFRWYQNSAVCYALLSDVDIHASDFGGSRLSGDNQVPFFDKVTQAVQSSRWFTRGWTLQELLAPSNVQFYSQDWTFLGAKNDTKGFQSLISDTTGIPTAVLDMSHSLDNLGIAERMQWASGRETTRLEDLAYCLMGIFNINMPLLYGEGTKAFIRLQEEILKGWYMNSQLIFLRTPLTVLADREQRPVPVCVDSNRRRFGASIRTYRPSCTESGMLQKFRPYHSSTAGQLGRERSVSNDQYWPPDLLESFAVRLRFERVQCYIRLRTLRCHGRQLRPN